MQLEQQEFPHPGPTEFGEGLAVRTERKRRKMGENRWWKASELPSGERLHFVMERSTIFHGKIHYFYGHFP